MTNKSAFTLAEVLITLGIIGVVAAMTIPTLISNTNGAQFKSAYKKSLSTLNQAAIMNIALDDYDFSSLRVKPATPEGETPTDATEWGEATKKTMAYILKNRLQSVTNFEYTTDDAVAFTSKGTSPLVGKEATLTTDFYSFTFADGTAFTYNKLAEKCVDDTAANCYGFLDVNGKTGPNVEVECNTATQNANDPTMAKDADTACEVDASGVTDIYPVRFYGQTLVPATDAARAVLYNK